MALSGACHGLYEGVLTNLQFGHRFPSYLSSAYLWFWGTSCL